MVSEKMAGTAARIAGKNRVAKESRVKVKESALALVAAGSFAAAGSQALLPGRRWFVKKRIVVRVQEDGHFHAGHALAIGQCGDLELGAFWRR